MAGVPAFVPFPKIPRLNRRIVVTEKLDGSNAAIWIDTDGDIYAASRNRWLVDGNDNYGFAKWVAANKESLIDDLDVGLHRGEFWGSGIQRGYGLAKGEKYFSLFNTSRWYTNGERQQFKTPSLSVVPLLYDGLFSQAAIESCLNSLAVGGSWASPGFIPAEGVVVFHDAGNSMFKITLDKDDQPKGISGA